MRFTTLLPALAMLSACASVTDREPAPRAVTEVLVKSTTSWDGAGFSYPAGEAEITVVRITIPAGVTLPMHCHPVPLAGALTRGILEVRKATGETIRIQEGSGLIEVSNQWHRGHAVEDTEIIVVYAGALDLPVTVLRDGDPDFAANCR